MIKYFYLILCLLYFNTLQTNAFYKGHVFLDNNKNGVFDLDEIGVANVLVSNGHEVVKTDKDGSFQLPFHDNSKFIFITTPSGHKTLNKYYQESSDKHKLYNFSLVKDSSKINKDGSHHFIQITDTEISEIQSESNWVNDINSYSKNEKTAFIIHTGDICYKDGLNAHIKLMNNENTNCPIYYCIGNHDLVEGNYGEELFEKLYGPTYYSFDVGNVHYIVTPMLIGDYKPSYTQKEVAKWLRNDLAMVSKEKSIVFFSHAPILDENQFLYSKDGNNGINLSDYKVKASVYGHWHTNYIKKINDILSICTSSTNKAGIDHSTNAYRVISIDQNDILTSHLRYTYINENIEIATPTLNQVTTNSLKAVPLVVNGYSSTSKINEMVYSCSINDDTLFHGLKLTQQTDWSWVAQMPLKKAHENKKIDLWVEATFNNGKTTIKKTSFEYGLSKQKVQIKENWQNLLENGEHSPSHVSGYKKPLNLKWTKNVGANIFMTSPLIYNNRVYIASVDENLVGEAYIYCLQGETGDIIWEYKTDNSIKNSISIDENKVLAQDIEGNLYAIDAENGQLHWQKKLELKNKGALTEGLASKDGVVYAGTGSGLCAINIANGKYIWKNSHWNSNMGSTATISVGQNTIIASSQWGGLYAHDLKTGALKWERKDDGLRNRASSATISKHSLHILSEKKYFEINLETGETIKSKSFPFRVDVTSTPLICNDNIYLGTANKGLVSLNKNTLEINWNFNIDKALIHTVPYTRYSTTSIETSPIMVGNTIFFASSDGKIYGIDAIKGHLVWSHHTGAPILSSVAISGNALFAADFGGNIYAFITKK